MSKGINISHIEDGEYSVEIELDTDAIDVEIASIAVKIADIETQIAELESDIVDVDDEITTITGEISAIDLQLKEKREEIVVVDDRLSEILEEIAVIDVRLLEIIDEIADLDSQMDSKAMLLSAISSSISVIDSQIAALEEEEQTPEVIAQIALLQSQRASLVSQQESVTEEYNTLSAEKGVLEAEQSTIEIEKTALESEQTTLEAEKVVLETELSDLQDEWNDLQQELTVSFDEKSTLETDKNIEELDKTALEKHKEFLEDPANTPVNPTEDIWCADLTEDLSGDVGIIEVAGAVGKGLNLQPGYEGNADYGGARDGMLKPAIAISSPGLYWNWAMRDGWQKWKPNYRYGTIAEIYYDTDTCDINLEECESTDTVQDANQDTALAGVPIEYMDCDSAAFNVDDEVIVKFEDNDWTDPKVIGFKEEPKSCTWERWDSSDEPDLCKNHQWEVWNVNDPDYDYIVCPTLPWIGDLTTWGGTFGTQTVDILDGVVSFSFDALADDERSTDLELQWTKDNNPDTEIDLAVTNKLKIKFTMTGTGESADGLREYGIYITTVEGDSAFLYIYNSDETLSYWDYEITDNIGEEQTLTLADYGIASGILKKFTFSFWVKGEICTGEMTCDYIDFIK